MKILGQWLRKQRFLLWLLFWLVIDWAGNQGRWAEYVRCYVLTIGGACGGVALFAYERPTIKQRSLYYIVGLGMVLIGLLCTSLAYFAEAIARSGTLRLLPTINFYEYVALGVGLAGSVLIWYDWKLAQQKYQRDYQDWQRHREQWERENPDWERQQRYLEWNYGRPLIRRSTKG